MVRPVGNQTRRFNHGRYWQGHRRMRRLHAHVERGGERASKWVDTELRAAIRKRVDDTGFRLIPIMIDDTELPALVAEYRGFPLKKVSDMEGIVRAFCPEPEIDIVARLQQRFLELVAKQFPEGDEVRYLFCPVCASKNLSAQIKHEPQFDERLYGVRCADCGWNQQAP